MPKSAAFLLGFSQGMNNALTKREIGIDSNIHKNAAYMSPALQKTLKSVAPWRKLLESIARTNKKMPRMGRPKVPPSPFPGYPFPSPKKWPFKMPPGAMDL